MGVSGNAFQSRGSPSCPFLNPAQQVPSFSPRMPSPILISSVAALALVLLSPSPIRGENTITICSPCSPHRATHRRRGLSAAKRRTRGVTKDSGETGRKGVVVRRLVGKLSPTTGCPLVQCYGDLVTCWGHQSRALRVVSSFFCLPTLPFSPCLSFPVFFQHPLTLYSWANPMGHDGYCCHGFDDDCVHLSPVSLF